MNRRSLEPLFAPRVVAVLGASRDPAKWGGLLARGALKGAHRRTVWLVNRNGGEGMVASLSELPEAPDLVVVCVPPDGFEQAVDAALAAGARAIVGITAGFPEERERPVAERVRAAGAILLGPNCLGVFDRDAELDLAPWVDLPPGEIGLIAQSGNLSLELGLLAADAGLGFSRFASLGNQADLEAAELVEEFARHEPTRLIALYVEDFRDGRAFARAAAAAGKPVVLLTVGGSEAGARAARSHTGALVSGQLAVDAACRAAGILRVSTPRELVDAAGALLRGKPVRGPRIAVLGDGGGHGVVAADVAARHGLRLPILSDRLRAEIAAVLPATATTANPVDFAGGAEQDIRSFERAGRLVLESGEVDALLVTGYFGGYGVDGEREVAAELARAAGEEQLVVHTMYPDSEAAGALRAGGALVYREIGPAIAALSALVERPKARTIPSNSLLLSIPGGEGYFAAREVVASAGIRLAEARSARSLDDVRAAARELGYPVVLKGLGHEHKSEGGGVVLGIADEPALEHAYRAVAGAECSVERMADSTDGVELIVGTRRDPRFGLLLLVGLGGIYAEVLDDVAVALAPVDADQAEELLRSLRCAPLLDGARGRPPVDVPAAARAAAGLSSLGAEVEINPLLVTPAGAVALDARVTMDRP